MVKKIKKVAEESGSAYKFGKELDFASAEAYNLLKTNISFSIPDTLTGKVIGITSPCPQEGKSTTSINLCYAIAEAGHTVVLVDSDMRRPSVAGALNIPSAPGLSNILAEDATGAIRKNILSEKMSVITSGDIPPNPSELLGSKRMATALEHLRQEFDYIIIDLPPVNLVSDALSIAGLITGMIVVIREEYTEKRELERFFRSNWCSMLSDIDGDVIIDKIQQMEGKVAV
jgi:capsular exopolysaccharide synthesis family protein